MTIFSADGDGLDRSGGAMSCNFRRSLRMPVLVTEACDRFTPRNTQPLL